MEGQSPKPLKEIEVTKSSLEGKCNLLLRLCAMVLTLVAAVVIAADKQTTVVPIKLTDSLPPLNVPVTAKWHYLSAYVYFVVANVIACIYATLSFIIALANGHKSKLLVTLVTLLDAIMVALLFSGNGAALAIGVLAKQGNSHVRWNKVCNVFDKFCNQVAASCLISLLGSLVFILITVLPVLRVHRRTT
ncbi:CASP protein 1E1 [Trifolium repens]|nr:CASP protein 1E1 [Trifolium repens]